MPLFCRLARNAERHRQELVNSNVYLCALAVLYSSGFTFKYVCIIHDLHSSYYMYACSVRMLNDIWNMLSGCVNICVHTIAFFCLLTLPMYGWVLAPHYLLVSSLSAGPSWSVSAENRTCFVGMHFHFLSSGEMPASNTTKYHKTQ